jgi:hypothetical protein
MIEQVRKELAQMVEEWVRVVGEQELLEEAFGGLDGVCVGVVVDFGGLIVMLWIKNLHYKTKKIISPSRWKRSTNDWTKSKKNNKKFLKQKIRKYLRIFLLNLDDG